jgi:hypothetical protein
MNINVVNEDEVIIDGVTYKREKQEESVKEVEREPKFKSGDTVYSIVTDEGAENAIRKYLYFTKDPITQFNLSIGNIFATREEAEAAIKKLQNMAKLNNKAGAIKESLNENLNSLSAVVEKQIEKLADLFN